MGSTEAGQNKDTIGPCGNDNQLNTKSASTLTVKAGDKSTIAWEYARDHGGTCDVLLSTAPTQAVQGQVTPAANTFNTVSGGPTNCAGITSREITIPDGTPAGPAVLEWTWVGDAPHFNCMDITIELKPAWKEGQRQLSEVGDAIDTVGGLVPESAVNLVPDSVPDDQKVNVILGISAAVFVLLLLCLYCKCCKSKKEKAKHETASFVPSIPPPRRAPGPARGGFLPPPQPRCLAPPPPRNFPPIQYAPRPSYPAPQQYPPPPPVVCAAAPSPPARSYQAPQPAPPQMPKPPVQSVTMMFEFKPAPGTEALGYMFCQAGDQLELVAPPGTADENPAWIWVKRSNGQAGYVPRNHIGAPHEVALQQNLAGW